MTNTAENNKRIAKNTMLLYVRMMILMIINLYISRVTLKYLGVEDFGIYGIVGSVIILFSFLNSAMSTCTSRFLSFYIGKQNDKEVNRTFCASINLYFILLLTVIILSETIGLYVINYILNIPSSRLEAANWVYQFTILTFCANILRIPYNSCIISYEKMEFYAYLGIADVLLKLGGIYLLLLINNDKLITYSIIMFIVSVFITLCFYLYCKMKIKTSRYKVYKIDFQQYKQLLSFSGWSLFSGIANMGANTGVNMLLNIFCGVSINAAVSIANQVSNAMYSFVSNFQTAFTPQITKLFASNDLNNCYKLVFQSSKFSYYLFGILILPFIISMPYILSIWLNTVPNYASDFTNLILIYLLIDALFCPLWLYIDATGKIKTHQIVTGLLILANFPISYFLLKCELSPDYVWYAKIIINITANIFRLVYLLKKFHFPSIQYIKTVLLPITLTSCIAIIPSISIYNSFEKNFIGICLFICCSILFSTIIAYTTGISKSERSFINRTIIKYLHIKK